MKFRITISALFAICMGTLIAQQQQPPAFPRAADALERVTWRTRTLVTNDRLTNWDFAIPGMGLTFLESVVRADAALVPYVEAASTQRVSAQIQKNLDYNLTPDEITAVKAGLGQNVRVSAYRLATLPADADVRRRVFQFAKALGATTLVLPAGTALADLDTLAEEFTLNVAVMDSSAETLKSMEGRSRRLGVGIDTGAWAQEGISPREGLSRVHERLRYVSLRDRSGRGAGARNVPPGKGVGNLTEFFSELQRLDVRGVAMTLDTTGTVNAPADLFTVVAAFEAAVQPAYATNFIEFSRTRPIRFDVVTPSRGETLSPAEIEKRAVGNPHED